jgi:hypothetical protein
MFNIFLEMGRLEKDLRYLLFVSPYLKLTNYDLSIKGIHPSTQETTPACRNVCLYKAFRRKQALRRAGTALAVEECVTPVESKTTIHPLSFGGFRSLADDPPKPWRLRTEALQSPGA